jgi:transmembrane sensor
MKEDTIALLLSKKLAGEASKEELDALQHWLQQHPEEAFTYEIINGIKQDTDSNDEELKNPGTWARNSWDKLQLAMNEPEPEVMPLQIMDPADENSTPVRKLNWYGVAAAITGLTVLVSGYFYWNRTSIPTDNEIAKNQIFMERGNRSSVKLPDGTLIWMNSSSKLTYGDGFAKGNRDVYLEGEAYFNIQKDEAHPFIIHTKKMDIKVLGTVFNVKAYPEDHMTEAALLSGKISVNIKGGKEQYSRDIVLLPEQKLVVNNSANLDEHFSMDELTEATSPIKILPVHCVEGNAICDEVGWVYNKLIFKDQTFQALAIRMERWYDVNIHFEDNSLKTETFNGVFEKENITEALKALQLATDFSFRHEGNDIYLKKIVR